MKYTPGIIFCIVVSLALCYCTTSEAPLETPAGDGPADSSAITQIVGPAFLSVDQTWADSVLGTMTLDEKIGQLIMVRGYSNQGTRHQAGIEAQIKKYGVGGIIFFQGGPVRQAKLTNRYQSISKIPLFIAMDGEWGLGMRLDSTMTYPYQMTLGAIQNDDLIKAMARDMGKQFNRLGVQWNLAPVVDINNNAKNPVINYRSFGEDRYNVVRKGHQYMAGLEEMLILSSLKHFPGHGDTSTDSHKALPIIDHGTDRLEDIELFPFRQLIGKGANTVMVGHLSVPALDSTQQYPTSLSKSVISDLLKGQMGFEGLVISDAMDMKGLTNYVEKGKREVLALQAGNDIIELVEDVPLAIQSIKEAVAGNQVPLATIDEKCKKVLLAKYWTGLFRKPVIQMENLYQDLNDSIFLSLVPKLHSQAITLLEHKDSTLNRLPFDTTSVAVVAVGSARPSVFAKEVAKTMNTTPLALPRYANEGQVRALQKATQKADYVLLSLHQVYRQPRVKLGYGKNTISFIESILADSNALLINFRNPYLLSQIKNVEKAKVVLLTYQDNRIVQSAASGIFSGNFSISGRLPVTINETWHAGHGTTLEK